jgi:hypothetical protein
MMSPAGHAGNLAAASSICKWDSVESATDVDNDVDVFRSESKTVFDRLGAVGEERHRREGCSNIVDVIETSLGKPQDRQTEERLTRDGQAFSTGRQDRDAPAGRQDGAHDRDNVRDQVLAIVEDEQQPAILDRSCERLDTIDMRAKNLPQRGRQFARDERAFSYRGEIDKPDFNATSLIESRSNFKRVRVFPTPPKPVMVTRR